MPRSLAESYSAQHAQALAAIMKIQDAVCDLPAPDCGVRIDWTHVGSLCELNRQLSDALAFIGAKDA